MDSTLVKFLKDFSKKGGYKTWLTVRGRGREGGREEKGREGGRGGGREWGGIEGERKGGRGEYLLFIFIL